MKSGVRCTRNQGDEAGESSAVASRDSGSDSPSLQATLVVGEPLVAVNREHAALVVEADERVDIAVAQQPAAKRCAAVVGGKPRRQHEPEAAAIPQQ
jgi:hypothetical protein